MYRKANIKQINITTLLRIKEYSLAILWFISYLFCTFFFFFFLIPRVSGPTYASPTNPSGPRSCRPGKYPSTPGRTRTRNLWDIAQSLKPNELPFGGTFFVHYPPSFCTLFCFLLCSIILYKYRCLYTV